MTKIPISTLTAGILLLGLQAGALPAAEADQRVLITDPALLESLGFEADAKNVYATEHALRRMALSPAERAAEDAALLATTEGESAGGPFGPGDGFTTISERSFRPRFSDPSAPSSYNSTPILGLYCIGGTHSYEAQLETLPHGAQLTSVRVYVYDDSPENIMALLLRTCQTSPNAGPDFTTLDFSSTAGTPTFRGLILLAGGDTVNNRICEYSLRVRLDDANTIFCSESQDLRLYKARAGWHRQISPPPAIATFDDVPAGHLFFQHVEALAAAGVTGGCDAENFCPNAPLTRGQMAAFLANALGLHWGVF